MELMFDTARVALTQLTDSTTFELVATAVLRQRHPELRVTGPSGDRGKDAFGRTLFGEKDDVVLLVSLQKTWTTKLGSEIDKLRSQPRVERPTKAIFVTNQS